MNQKTQILNILAKNPWTCGSVFQQNYLPEFRSMMNKLRKDGHIIQDRWCKTHNHHMKEWALMPNRVTAVPGVCCASKAIFNICERNCPNKDIAKDTIAGVLF